MNIHPAHYLPFSQVCRGLPDLRPRSTQGLLRAAFARREAVTQIAGIPVAGQDLAELFVEVVRDGYPTRAVSPAGAALLVRLYLAAALDTGRKPIGQPSNELLAYSRGEGPWLEPARQRSDSRATYEAKLAAPSAVTEAEFTPRLLDDLFRRHCGRGEAQLEIGGRLVRRIPRKVVDPEQGMLFGIFFEWISDGGEVRQLSVTSKQSGIWPN